MMKKIATCLAAFGLLCVSAHADTTQSLSNGATLGAHAGVGVLGNSGGTHFSVGVNASTPVWGPIFGGFNFSYIDEGGISSSGNSASGSLYLLNGSINYDSSTIYPGSFFGVAMGVGFNHTSVNIPTVASNSHTDTNFYIGPRLGADFALSSEFTIGAQADWLITPANGAPNVLEALAVVKWWL